MRRTSPQSHKLSRLEHWVWNFLSAQWLQEALRRCFVSILGSSPLLISSPLLEVSMLSWNLEWKLLGKGWLWWSIWCRPKLFAPRPLLYYQLRKQVSNVRVVMSPLWRGPDSIVLNRHTYSDKHTQKWAQRAIARIQQAYWWKSCTNLTSNYVWPVRTAFELKLRRLPVTIEKASPNSINEFPSLA